MDLLEENPLLAYEEKALNDIKSALQEIDGDDAGGFGHVLHRVQLQLKGQPLSDAITLNEQHALLAKIDSLHHKTKLVDSVEIDLSPMVQDDTAYVMKESGAIKMHMNIDTPAGVIAPIAAIAMPAAPAAPKKGWFESLFGTSSAAPKTDDKKLAADAPKADDKKSTDAQPLAAAEKMDADVSDLLSQTKVNEAPGLFTWVLDMIHPGYLSGIISKPAHAESKADDKKPAADLAPAIKADLTLADASPLTASVLNIAKGKPSTLKIDYPIDPSDEVAKKGLLQVESDVDSLLKGVKINGNLPDESDVSSDVDSLLNELVVPPSLSQVIAAKDVVSGNDDVEDLIAGTRVTLQAAHSPTEPGMTYSGTQASGELKSAIINLRLATEHYTREVQLKEVAEIKLNNALIRLNDSQKAALDAGNNADKYRDDTNSNAFWKFGDKYITARANDFPPELKLGWAQGKKAAIHTYADAEIAKLGKETFNDGNVRSLSDIKTLIGGEISRTEGLLKLSQDQFAKLEGQYQDSKKGKWFSAVIGGTAPEGYYPTKQQVSTQEQRLSTLKVKQLEVAELEKKVAAWDNFVDALNNETAAKLHVVTCQQEHGAAVAKVASAEIPMKAAEALVDSLQAPHHEHHANNDAGHDMVSAPITSAAVDEHALAKIHTEF